MTETKESARSGGWDVASYEESHNYFATGEVRLMTPGGEKRIALRDIRWGRTITDGTQVRRWLTGVPVVEDE